MRPGRVRWLIAGVVAVVACGDYARRGNKVFMDDGADMGHEVVILSGSFGRIVRS